MKIKYITSLAFLTIFLVTGFFTWRLQQKEVINTSPPLIQKISKTQVSPTPTAFSLKTIPQQKTLPGGTHTFQTFNNCGPASLSMALSLYGINVSQQTLGQQLRPYQNSAGDNDDKSVTLAELAEKSKEYGFIPYHRPNGNVDLIKNFINYDIPIITRTWTQPYEDIGHFRVIKGYNEITQTIIQDDSLQGKNLSYTYADFDVLWEKFGYEFLVLIPKEKIDIAKAILKDDENYKVSWEKAVRNINNSLTNDPNNIYLRFNLSIAYYNTGDYKNSVLEFEKVENRLPFRTLWYQIEPILAYQKLGNYGRVLEITDKIINNYNRAFSELYIIRGEIYKEEGNLDLARSEFEKAVFYNSSLLSAQEALNSI